MPDPGALVAVHTVEQEKVNNDLSGSSAAGSGSLALLSPDWSKLRSVFALEVTRQTPDGPKTYMSTAILLTPTLGIAAAHSLESLSGAPVTQVTVVDDYVVRKSSRRIVVPLHKIQTHPDYRGNRFEGIDLARFELAAPLDARSPFVLKALDESEWSQAILQRVGFGGRGDGILENRRTWVLENFRREWVGQRYVSSDDQFGFPGDSGGPVFMTRTPGTYELVGIHVGRMLEPQSQTPRDRSNTLVLTPDLIRWIEASPGLPVLQKVK